MDKHSITIINEIDGSKIGLSFLKEESLLLLCEKAGIDVITPCGGSGRCGKCRVKYLSGAPMPVPAERKLLSPDELRDGVRLLCVSKVSSDAVVTVSGLKMSIIGDGIGYEWIRPSGVSEGSYVVCCDIGSTTVAMQLRNAVSGDVVSEYREKNRQTVYGPDVMTRMESALKGNADKIREAIVNELTDGIDFMVNEAGISKEAISFMSIACNTVMMHLLMGYPVDKLAVSPFEPYTLNDIETEIDGIKTYVIPAFSGFVGGDIRADMLVAGDKPYLMADLGTNGEIVLFDGNKAYACGTAAGSAMDSSSMYASDAIGILASLYENGLIDCHGTFTDEGSKKDIRISQDDIRSLQLAKAAIRSGMEILFKKAGVSYSDTDCVYLAGGAGRYLDTRAAVATGLFPGELSGKIVEAGNMALAGAGAYADKMLIGEAAGPSYSVECVNLALEDEFNDLFVRYMDLPDTKE